MNVQQKMVTMTKLDKMILEKPILVPTAVMSSSLTIAIRNTRGRIVVTVVIVGK